MADPRLYLGYSETAANADLDALPRGRVSATTLGNAPATLTPGPSAETQLATVALTADRIITLDTVIAAEEGAYFYISRTGAGAFNYVVKDANAATIVTLATNQWAQVMVDEAGAWRLIAFGSLT